LHRQTAQENHHGRIPKYLRQFNRHPAWQITLHDISARQPGKHHNNASQGNPHREFVWMYFFPLYTHQLRHSEIFSSVECGLQFIGQQGQQHHG
jgi:hypothetical protein